MKGKQTRPDRWWSLCRGNDSLNNWLQYRLELSIIMNFLSKYFKILRNVCMHSVYLMIDLNLIHWLGVTSIIHIVGNNFKIQETLTTNINVN